MVENKDGYDTGFVTFYDNPGLKAYAEPAVNLNASLEGYISDQGWVEGSEMYFRVIIGNPDGGECGKTDISGIDTVIDEENALPLVQKGHLLFKSCSIDRTECFCAKNE